MPIRCISLLWITLLLAACGSTDAPQANTTQPPGLRYTPLPTVLAAPGGSLVTAAGYYYTTGGEGGATLVGGLSFGGERPAPLDDQPGQQVWLGDATNPALQGGLHSSGDVRYAPLLATGRLEGPGAYGPGGRYAFQLSGPSLTLLVPTAVTVTGLLAKSFNYDGQFVRVSGALLANADDALLVDRLEAGGMPARTSHQLKLAEPVRDRPLLQRLKASTGGLARYGPVEVEGFWRSGTLIALSIMPRP